MGIGQCSVSFHLQIYHTSCQCKHSKIIGLQRRLCETHNLDFDFKSVNSYGQKGIYTSLFTFSKNEPSWH